MTDADKGAAMRKAKGTTKDMTGYATQWSTRRAAQLFFIP
jgi:hypothetical protein